MRYTFSFLILMLNVFQIWGQASQPVDFLRVKGEVTIHPERKEVRADLLYHFEVQESVDSIFLDAHGMYFSEVALDGQIAPYTNTGEQLILSFDFEAGKTHQLRIVYQVKPEQTMYFVGWEQQEEKPLHFGSGSMYSPQVWTQGQGKYTSHWLPSFDDTREKLEFDLTYNFPKDYTVIANGELQKRTVLNDSTVSWQYDMKHPMSSYLLAMAAGNYQWEEVKTSKGVPVYLYHYPQDEDLVEPTYRHTLEIFNFLEEEIGIPYPWQNYKQIPVRNFLHSGMENTGTTIFSDFFMSDSLGFKDRNYIMVNAHEMAHQWFGNLATAAGGKDHWLQEGFATYYALLAERAVLGDEHYYWKLFEWAEELQARSDRGEGEAVMRTGGSSLTYYYHGAWVLHVLRDEIGDEAFRQGVQHYLLKYQFSNASTEDFLSEMEAASGQDMSVFSRRWLEQSAFPAEEALVSLRKSGFINRYLQIAALKELPLHQKQAQLEQALDFPVNDYIGQQVIHQLALEDATAALELYRKAFQSNNLFVRQAIALSLPQVPPNLRDEYESLLKDDSYLTKEAALYHLWMSFPENRSRYLEEMQGVEGFYDKNIETLWLALNLATPEFEPEKQGEVYDRLRSYTHSSHPFHIRRNAFRYLFQLNAFGPESLVNLSEGTQHQVWRFRSFCRQLMEELMGSKEYRDLLEGVMPQLPPKEQTYIRNQLEQ